MPMLFKPQQANRFFKPGTSPKSVFVSGVNDSGPEKIFLFQLSLIKELFLVLLVKMVQSDQNFLETLQMKNLLELFMIIFKCWN